MEPAAVGPLLAVLAGEMSRDVYQGTVDQRDFPQWPGGSSQYPLEDLSKLPPEAAIIPERGAVSELLNRWRLKQAAITALGLIGDARALPAVLSVLDVKDTSCGWGMTGVDFYPVRKAAVEALGLIGDSSALDVLRRTAEESEINTRFAAQDAIAWLERGELRDNWD